MSRTNEGANPVRIDKPLVIFARNTYASLQILSEGVQKVVLEVNKKTKFSSKTKGLLMIAGLKVDEFQNRRQTVTCPGIC